MQIGVDNFTGQRLKEALSYRQVSNKHLSESIGVNPANITKYINGTIKPSPVIFDKISLFLKFPHSYFTNSDQEDLEEEQLALWRSLKSATKRSRNRGAIILKWQQQCYEYFSAYFDYPKFVPPDIKIPSSFDQIDNPFIDEYCLRLREVWNLGDGPIQNLTLQLEKKGFSIASLALNNPKQDAVSSVLNDVPFILINSEVKAAARIRFNLAHELGHILLHRSVVQDDLDDNDKFNEIEEQAHYFATSLLLPESQLVSDFWAPTLKCIESIKAKWNVSMQAIMRRSLELGLMTSSQFSYLNIAISRKGWRVVEPFDETTPSETIRLFSQSLERISERHQVSQTEVIEKLSIPYDAATQLLQIPDSRGGETEDNVVRFPT